MDINILKESKVDVDHGLELLGDIDMYNETMGDFLDEIEEKLPRVIEYKNKGDMPNYAILVHSIKSDSKYLGFTSLAEIALEHEMKSKENDINYVNEHFLELENEVKRIIDVAKKYLGR